MQAHIKGNLARKTFKKIMTKNKDEEEDHHTNTHHNLTNKKFDRIK